jgi:hypothetical protein
MRRSIVLLFVSQSLFAQAPKLRPSVSVDLAALTTGEVRLALEPLVHGRGAFGVSLARWWGGNTYYATPLEATSQLAPVPGIDQLHPSREYMIDLYARAYPLSFASAAPKHPISGYVGGFIGVHRRENQQSVIYGLYPCPLDVQVCPANGPCQPTCPPPVVSKMGQWGVEPGAEIGFRFNPLNDVFVEVGGRARLITFPDPTGRFEEGQIDSRLTIAVGVGW